MGQPLVSCRANEVSIGATIVVAFGDGWQLIIHGKIILDSKSEEGFLLSLYC